MEVPKWTERDDGSEVLYLTTVEEAKNHLPFSITVPSGLPSNAVFDNVFLIRTKESDTYWYSAHIYFTINYNENEWNLSSAPYINIKKSNYPDGKILFEFSYDLVTQMNNYEGIYNREQVLVAGEKAVIFSTSLPHVLGLEPLYDGYTFGAFLEWHRGDFSYSLTASVPSNDLNYNSFIAIAESIE